MSLIFDAPGLELGPPICYSELKRWAKVKVDLARPSGLLCRGILPARFRTSSSVAMGFFLVAPTFKLGLVVLT